MKKDLIYSTTCLAFAIIIGGAIYEHLGVVPQWSAAPPVSLTMFQGQYGLKPETFWMIIHPLTVLLFVVSLILHWKTRRKKTLLLVFGGYVCILIITSIYFVPELISIITTTPSSVVDADMTRRAATWEALSIVRLFVLIISSLVLFSGLTKSGHSLRGEKRSNNLVETSPAHLLAGN